MLPYHGCGDGGRAGTGRAMKKLQIARIGYNVISAIFFFAALLCLLFPRTSPFAVCLFSGVLLVAYGIIKIVGYFSEDLFCLAFRYDFAFGLLLLATGGLLLVRYQTAAEYLVTGFGWLLLLDGFFRIQTSQDLRPGAVGGDFRRGHRRGRHRIPADPQLWGDGFPPYMDHPGVFDRGNPEPLRGQVYGETTGTFPVFPQNQT